VWEKEVLGRKTSFNLSGSNFSKAVENQFRSIEIAMQEIVKQVNDNNYNLTTSVRMLEFEKNKIKRELGNREDIHLNEHFDAISVWSTLSAMADHFKESPHTTISKPEDDFKLSLLTLIQTKYNILDKAIRIKASKHGVDEEMEVLKRDNLKQQKEISDLKLLVVNLSNHLFKLETKLENKVLDKRDSSDDCKILEEELRELRKEMKLIKPSSNPRSFKFQDLSIENLRDIQSWLTKNVSDMNYALITNIHIMLDHVNHQIYPSKTSLDFMQTIRKLEIPSANHAITIQSFKSSLPKYFCKSKDYLVMKVDDPLFTNIKNFEDWDEPNYSYKVRLNEEADNAMKNIEHAISNARTLIEHGQAIC